VIIKILLGKNAVIATRLGLALRWEYANARLTGRFQGRSSRELRNPVSFFGIWSFATSMPCSMPSYGAFGSQNDAPWVTSFNF
jgi:hypothetical protein